MPDKDYSAMPLTRTLGAKPGAAALVFFTTSSADLAKRFAKLKRTLEPADGVWIVWPKKSSTLETDLDFDRFVYRLSERPPQRAPSARRRA